MPELQCGLAQADVFHMRGMGDLRGLVVSHLRRQRGYEHQRVLHVPVQFGAIDLNAFDHVLHVSVAGICDQGDGMQEVVNHHRLVNVELEIPLRACESYRSGCPVNLNAYHGHGFRLCRVHLARHDGGARFVLRDRNFAQPATWAGSQPANVVRNLHERGRQRFQRALCEDNLIVRRERSELVGMGAEGKSRKFRNLVGSPLREFGMCVQPGPHSGSADSQIVQPVERLLQTFDIAFQQASPAPELLADGKGYGILQVRAPNLDHVIELFCLGRNRIMNRLDRGN